jgi:hypothetical protein
MLKYVPTSEEVDKINEALTTITSLRTLATADRFMYEMAL